uniref:Uncharacterized protein n=1 Tax=Peronospora matthiolae TaxID=2874970 RepID=A0AAV1V8C0_9STRA
MKPSPSPPPNKGGEIQPQSIAPLESDGSISRPSAPVTEEHRQSIPSHPIGHSHQPIAPEAAGDTDIDSNLKRAMSTGSSPQDMSAHARIPAPLVSFGTSPPAGEEIMSSDPTRAPTPGQST